MLEEEETEEAPAQKYSKYEESPDVNVRRTDAWTITLWKALRRAVLVQEELARWWENVEIILQYMENTNLARKHAREIRDLKKIKDGVDQIQMVLDQNYIGHYDYLRGNDNQTLAYYHQMYKDAAKNNRHIPPARMALERLAGELEGAGMRTRQALIELVPSLAPRRQ